MKDVGLEKRLDKSIIEYDAETKKYSTFGIGGKALAVLKPRDKKELIAAVRECVRLKLRHQVIGNGSNVLFKSASTKTVFITTKFMKPEYKAKNNLVSVSAGTMFSEFMCYLIERGYSGLEELYGIPATIGGMVMMNAGAFNKQVFDRLESVEVLDNAKVKTLNKSEVIFSHHNTSLLKTNKIVLSASFRLDRLAPSVIQSKCKEIIIKRNEKQPKGKSAGSVFQMAEHNVPAGLLIDNVGLKGFKIGDAVISEKHANFIINCGNATDVQVKQLITHIKKVVKEKYNVNLKREIEYMGERYDYYR